MPTYTAHRISSNDNILFPDTLEIDDQNVTFHKASLIGHNTIVIARYNITSVQGRYGIFFADVVIESAGGRRIHAEGFRKADVREIVELLTM